MSFSLCRPQGDGSNWVVQAELVSFFSPARRWGAGLFPTVEGTSATCAALLAERCSPGNVVPGQYHAIRNKRKRTRKVECHAISTGSHWIFAPRFMSCLISDQLIVHIHVEKMISTRGEAF